MRIMYWDILAFLFLVTVQAVPPPTKPGNCPSTGLFTICMCRPQPSECSTDYDCKGVDKCCSLACDCRKSCVPPGDCLYNRKAYLIGETFPAKDGCNVCTCMPDKTTSCTEKACNEY